jgi:hypothetical protein
MRWGGIESGFLKKLWSMMKFCSIFGVKYASWIIPFEFIKS